MAEKRTPDFTGWATKFGIKCTDGRTILKGAFDGDEGRKVPLVWQHNHEDPDYVLGHALLFNKPEGVWAEGYLNNGAKADSARVALENGDIEGLSIYANGLKHVNGREVAHGNIRELSLVLAGANMGATIQNVMLQHGDLIDELEDEAIIYGDDMPLMHSDKPVEEEPEAELEHEDKEKETMAESEKTVKEIWDSMTEEQQNVCYFMIGKAMEEAGVNEEDDDEAEHSDNEGEVLTMRRNVFEQEAPASETILSHADQMKIIERAHKLGSMKNAWEEALETNDTLSHAVFNDDGTEQTYGIANIDYLFPDYQNVNNGAPDFIRRPDEWVTVVINGVTKTPFARMKTVHANITMDEARAKGYIKGNEKKDEVFNLLRRTVDPQTIYKHQKFDRDDIIDVNDFDVIAWVKVEMKDMLNEEIARAILIGDGRTAEDPDKIQSTHVKPILTDDDLYTIKCGVTAGSNADATAKNAIRAIIKSASKYKGSGNKIAFMGDDKLSDMLLLEDGMGRELYTDVTALARKMRVNRIVTCPLFDGLKVDGQDVVALIVDLKDYRTGTDRRGQVEFFDDFDIDFNQMKYLIETRMSGMLCKPFSAIAVTVGAAPGYTTVEQPTGSPRAQGYYEQEGEVYRKSADATVIEGKTYFTRA